MFRQKNRKSYIWGDSAQWVCATVLEFIVLRLNSVRKLDVFLFFEVLLDVFILTMKRPPHRIFHHFKWIWRLALRIRPGC